MAVVRVTSVVLLITLVLATSSPVGVNFALALQKVQLDVNVAAQKVREAGFTRAKIFDVNEQYLQALDAVGIKDVVVAAPNYMIEGLCNSAADGTAGQAREVANRLAPYVKERGMSLMVAVGNEPLAPWYNGQYKHRIALAVERMGQALDAAGLDNVPLTVPFYFGLVENSYPPTDGKFKDDASEVVKNVARLLIARSRCVFMVNPYPYFAFVAESSISLEYATGMEGATVGASTYLSLLNAEYAATRAALDRLGAEFASLDVVIGETGWPTAGSDKASVIHARDFVTNAAAWARETGHIIYLFEAFDEQKKADAGTGGTNAQVENHFGLFTEAGEPKYDLDGLVSGEMSKQSPAPAPPDGNGESNDVCTAERNDPFASGSEVPCCAGTDAELKKWKADRQEYYLCVATTLTTTDIDLHDPTDVSGPVAHPTPSPSDANGGDSYAEGSCTPTGNDPWASGSEVPCCAGTDAELKKWKADRQEYYLCVGTTVTTTDVDPLTRDTTDENPGDGSCTPTGNDPWASGSEVPCCAGTDAELKKWNANRQEYYLCVTTTVTTTDVDVLIQDTNDTNVSGTILPRTISLPLFCFAAIVAVRAW